MATQKQYLQQPEVFQGARQLGELKAALRPKVYGEITSATPQSEIAERAANTRWNYARGAFPGEGAAWASSAGGAKSRHGVPGGFERPPTGPDSLTSFLRRQTVQGTNGPGDNPPQGGGAAAAVTAGAGGVAPAPAPPAAPAAGTIPAAPAPVLRRTTNQQGGAMPLGYGQVVNGVDTYSDGTGGMTRTMTPESMQQLAQARSISRADTGALGNVLASDVTGAPVSTADRVATLVRNTPVPITGSRPTAQQFADADRENIALRDPRSAAGIAARNLAIDAQYGSSSQRRMAEAALTQLSAGANTGGLLAQQGEQQQAAIGAQGANALANIAAGGRNALQAIQLQGANQLADTTLTARLRPPEAGKLVQAEDGSYAVVDPSTAGARAVLSKDGKPLRGLPKNPAPPIYTNPGGAQTMESLTNSILGINPATGVRTGADGKDLPPPTGAERFAAMQQANGMLQQLGARQAAQPAASAGPPAQAVADLKADPARRAEFDQKYGAGAAARVLGK